MFASERHGDDILTAATAISHLETRMSSASVEPEDVTDDRHSGDGVFGGGNGVEDLLRSRFMAIAKAIDIHRRE